MDRNIDGPPNLECSRNETILQSNGNDELLDQTLPTCDCKAPSLAAPALPTAASIRLIDTYCFSRECLTDALTRSQPNLIVRPFSSVVSCIAEELGECELVVLNLHADETSDGTAMQQISSIAKAFPKAPLVVLSDAENAHQLKAARNILKCGARGVVATRTIGLSVAVAAIRLVGAGGVFAPMDIPLSGRAELLAPPANLARQARQARLTTRQMVVLSHIERGLANKTIAYELQMSESTVKVHVRNIMRKVGATNRTQAVYKAQKVWEGAGLRSPDV